ncbi:Antiviral helicase ski2 [Maublancomyces gigas]|uniref:Antiviral helicase ski2 n=1 Tax=Discina gigas TaxID=1032678 RepID=A0ABR3GCH2_9PEZI
MILNLLRVEALKIEEMIKRSFSEDSTQTLLPQHEQQMALSEQGLRELKKEACEICVVDLETGPRTVGVLVKDGILQGERPLKVLMLRPDVSQKSPSDMIPFPIYTALGLQGLSKTKWDLREHEVTIFDIEFITKTTLKLDIEKVRSGDRTAITDAQARLVDLASDFKQPEWTEGDWSKVKDMTFMELNQAKQQETEAVLNATCLSCPKFLAHFTIRDQEYGLQNKIAGLKQLMSDQNLRLLPDYEQRVSVLKELGFIDANSNVELKGRVACEVNSTSELVLTELVLENVLAEYEPEEIVALLSAFVFGEKTDVIPTITPKLEKGKAKIIEIAKKVNSVQNRHQVVINAENDDFEHRPRFGLMEVVYEWAKGMSFNQITDLTDVLEGTIVRVITRLDETCREVKNSARIIGDPSLFAKMQECQELIKRDVCHCASLYL